MASKKIRKKGEPRLGGSPGSKHASKSGKKGCLFWLIVLALMVGVAVYQRDRIRPYLPQISQAEEMAQGLWADWFGEETQAPSPEELPSPELLEVEPPPAPKPKKKPKKIKPQPGQKLQYVQVGNCLTVQCRVQLVGEIESLGLPSMVKRVSKRTLYYELVSKKLYTRSLGESKILDIERHAPAAPAAALRAKGARWQVSLGEFPQKRQAVYMQSYLAQLYPDVDLPLKLQPRRRRLTAQYVYAGPFSSRFNAEQVAELLRDRRFIQETIVVANP